MTDLTTPLKAWSLAEARAVVQAQIAANVAADDARLTDRNTAIIDAVRGGATYAAVAARMDLTPAIVEGVIRRHAPELIGRSRRRKVAA